MYVGITGCIHFAEYTIVPLNLYCSAVFFFCKQVTFIPMHLLMSACANCNKVTSPIQYFPPDVNKLYHVHVFEGHYFNDHCFQIHWMKNAVISILWTLLCMSLIGRALGDASWLVSKTLQTLVGMNTRSSTGGRGCWRCGISSREVVPPTGD